MPAADYPPDPQERLSEGLRAIREALHDLREGVVHAVMRRNRIQDEVGKLERLLEELKARSQQALAPVSASMKAELDAEVKNRGKELERLRAALARAVAEAESAKIRLPEEEAQLQRKLHDLRARFVSHVGAQIAGGATGPEAAETWDRATGKVQDLENEASARREVAGASLGGAGTVDAPAPDTAPTESSVEAAIRSLEARIGEPDTAAAGGEQLPGTAEPSAEAPADPSTQPESDPGGLTPAPPPAHAEAADEAGIDPPPAEAPAFETGVGVPFAVVTRREGDRSRMESLRRVRVAGIGTGNIFRGAHLPVYTEIPQAQLVALCDPDKEAQDLAYKRLQRLVEARCKVARERDDLATVERLESDLENVQVCADISEVIEKVKPDLADICTQPFLHAPLAIQALEGGINVMCEKPLSRSWLESQRLIEAVQRTGKLYQHNENWLWDGDYYTAKKLVDAGVIGEPILMFLATAHGGPEGSPKFWNPEFGGGGALLDNGIHAIGASWYISGLDKAPTCVKAAAPFGMQIRMANRIIDGRFQRVTVEDDAHILIRFENAQSRAWTTAHVEGSWSHRDSPDTAIIGTTGRITFASDEKGRHVIVTDAFEREVRRIEGSGPTWQPWPSSFYGEVLNMVECVRNNVESISTAQFGADCSAIVGAAYLSQANGGRGVSPDEFKSYARDIAARYPGDPGAADNALVEALLGAVRDEKKGA